MKLPSKYKASKIYNRINHLNFFFQPHSNDASLPVTSPFLFFEPLPRPL